MARTPQKLDNGMYLADDADLAGSVFHKVKLAEARFEDVNLRGATFDNVALTGATFRNVCLGNVSIEDAGLEGMRINGILVTELLRCHAERQSEGESNDV